MKRGRHARLSLGPLLLSAVVSVALPAVAQPRPGPGLDSSSSQPVTEDQRKAQEHFQRAKELYQAGSYRDAVAELEVARALDPKAKDLAMNLGIVHEKLGHYDDALGWFKTYLEMEGVTANERSRAEGYIRRIEGAKRAAAAKAPPPGSVPAPSSSGSAPPAPVTPPAASATTDPSLSPAARPEPRGRVDGATIAFASIAAAGLAAGTGFGIYAMTSRPDDFVTGRDGSYATFQQKTDDAHTMAIIADVGFGVGILAALATAYFYFGRTKDPAKKTSGSGFYYLGGAF